MEISPRRLVSIFFFAAVLSGCGKEKIMISLTEIKSPSKNDLASITFLDEKTGLAVGGNQWASGQIFSTTDGGQTWNLDTTTTQKLFGCQFDRRGNAYAVGLSGRIFFRKKGETHWILRREDFKWYRGCDFWDEKNGLLAAGEGFIGGLVRQYKNNIIDFRDTSFEQELDAVQFADSLTAIACGYGTVVRSTDGGQTWTRLDLEGDNFIALHFPTASTGFIAGQFGTILKTTDAGKTWKKIRTGGTAWGDNHFNSIFFETENKGYLAGESGLFWKTDDGGSTWKIVENAPSDLDFLDIFIKNGNAWLVGSGGRIFRFDD